MPRYIRNWLNGLHLLILGVAVFAVLPHVVMAQAVSAADQAALAGPWNGVWTASNFRYEATMALNAGTNGDINGSINWTLRASPRATDANKIGMKGVEYVRGKYYPDSGTLVFEGYRKDDPNAIIGLDMYRLVISPTHNSLGGITWHHGPWTGEFFLTRRVASPASALLLPT